MNAPVTPRGLVGATATAPEVNLSAPTAFAPEPVVGMLQRAAALRVLVDHIDTQDSAGEAAYAEMTALVDDAADLTITTPAGALAALEWARGEFAFAHVEKPQPDHLDVVTLRFLDGAIGVLRAVVAGGPA